MNVMIAGGGTGGHLFPGIAVAQELRRRDPKSNILFVGTKRGIEVNAVPKAGFELQLLPVLALRRVGFVGLCRGLISLPVSLLKAVSLVHKFKPDIAVSVGGYAAGPAVLTARLMGVRCVVMEQNAVMGFTNRLLSRIAHKVFSTHPLSEVSDTKTEIVGNPVRAGLISVGQKEYHPQKPVRLLVFGGSQGARAINQVMMSLVEKLSESGQQIRITHQTGKSQYEEIKKSYEPFKTLELDVRPFIDDMVTAYENADLVLCRSGATTLAELTVCGRPAILIPFPYAVDDHQTKNAKALAQKGAAIHLAQANLKPEKLMDLIKELSENSERLKKMAKASLGAGYPDAVKKIVDSVTSLCLASQGAANV
jgi:UDP-N-acetylglucosamine--N-acetylmuramyl-(pentapeptide) pyrophosphoryl-undecaprenol N-acetylglucosamine transferase